MVRSLLMSGELGSHQGLPVSIVATVELTDGAFYHTALTPFLARINTYLLRWIRKKYRRYRGLRQAYRAWGRAVERYPSLFAHWTQVTHPLLIKRTGTG